MENLQQTFDVSQRRACVVLDQPRSSQRYVSEVRSDEPGLVVRMLQLSRERPRFGEVARDLSDPGGIGLGGDTGDFDAAGLQLQDDEGVQSDQPFDGPDLDAGEIDGVQRLPVGFQKGFLGESPFAFRDGFEAGRWVSGRLGVDLNSALVADATQVN